VSGDTTSFALRVGARMAARERPRDGERVVVAFSGGLDSLVLLHLLRFAPELPRTELIAAHFDHRMRAGSADDARWVAERALGWDVPLEGGAARTPPASEAAARDARYEFLESVRARVGARWIVTAHHADDQAETVLFRIARGTGLAGLRGIPERRGALLRPLLSFWRVELEAYARAHGLEPRPDPSNADPRFARNVVRAELLPRLETAVAPAAKRALVRLARLSAREERAWRTLLAAPLAHVILEERRDRVVVAAPLWLGYPSAVRARVLRTLVRRLGGRLDEAGTQAATEFTRSAASGRSQPPARRPRALTGVRPPGAGARGGAHPGRAAGDRRPGRGRGTLRGRRAPPGGALVARSAAARGAVRALATPIPAPLPQSPTRDRIHLAYGSKKLKKLLNEARIPLSERERVPVLVDGKERVLWLPGLARGAGTEPGPEEAVLHIGISDEDRP
jgi:tRNA(Ile)-lysidine synthase